MICLVQRPRGPRGWAPEYEDLEWPDDTTPTQHLEWHLDYLKQCKPERTHDNESPLGLTGKSRFRLGWRGRLVLQVECRIWDRFSYSPMVGWVPPPDVRKPTLEWVDATILDLQELQRISGISITRS